MKSSHWANRLLLLGFVLVTCGLVTWKYGSTLSLDYLATQEEVLRDYQQEYRWLAYLAAFALYVVVTGLSIPGAVVLTLLYGWFFGFLPAVILVSFASTLGATVAFWLSRYLFREAMEARFGQRLGQFTAALRREGPYYLFTLRLIPVVPFFVINVVMGLTPLTTSTFWWVSQIGMLPGTLVYVYAGASVPTLAALAQEGTGGILSVRVVAAFAAIGIFPLLVRLVLKRIGPRRNYESLSHD